MKPTIKYREAPEGGSKRLDGFAAAERWTTHLGCLEGAAKHLGLPVTPAWLYGATGHAFVICLGSNLCPSGPHCWNQTPLHRLSRNLPLSIQGVAGAKATPELLAKAWDHVRAEIDAGRPCYGWHWEWVAIRGYDADGYRVGRGMEPMPWQDFGAKAIGFLEIYSVRPKEPATDAKTVRDALAFAVAWADSSGEWTGGGYHGGPGAYEVWAKGIEAGEADAHGMFYHAAIWAECRTFAAAFLTEAEARLAPRHRPLLHEAAGHYAEVAKELTEIARLGPIPPLPFTGADIEPVKPKLKAVLAAESARIAAALRRARRAEEAGIAVLRRVVTSLEAEGARRDEGQGRQ